MHQNSRDIPAKNADAEMLFLLLEHDEPLSEDYSESTFDYQRAQELLHSLVSRIEEESKETVVFETGDKVQDATFHARILMPKSTTCASADVSPALYLSNFGAFATLFPESAIRQEPLVWIRSALSDLGYVYVPQRLLELPYNGRNEYFIGHPWWHRYFDWV